MLSEFDTCLGHMALATRGGEIVGLTFGHRDGQQAIESLNNFHAKDDSFPLREAVRDTSSDASFFNDHVAKLLRRFAEGERIEFDDVPISLDGMTNFQKQVVAACRAIPWGETVSYGELAAVVGHSGAARAVGTVMRRNRVPLIVPCHRVLAAGGQLGGYSAPAGLEMKKRLLALENLEQYALHF